MKYAILLFGLCVCLFGYSQNNTTRDYHENGKLKFEGTFKDGKKEGIHRWWYRTGQIEFELSFKNDKKNGLSRVGGRMGN